LISIFRFSSYEGKQGALQKRLEDWWVS
jgi:hypothetical protein